MSAILVVVAISPVEKLSFALKFTVSPGKNSVSLEVITISPGKTTLCATPLPTTKAIPTSSKARTME